MNIALKFLRKTIKKYMLKSYGIQEYTKNIKIVNNDVIVRSLTDEANRSYYASPVCNKRSIQDNLFR